MKRGGGVEGEIPDLAEAVEERQGVDALLVGEVDDAIKEVVLDDLEAGVELVRAEVDCGEALRPSQQPA